MCHYEILCSKKSLQILVYIITRHPPIFFFTFRHLVTFHARLNDFGSVRFSYEHNYIACLSICTTMQLMVVYESIAYIGLSSSAVDHSDPQSEKAHIKTSGFKIWFMIQWEYYTICSKCIRSRNIFKKNTAAVYFFPHLTIDDFWTSESIIRHILRSAVVLKLYT